MIKKLCIYGETACALFDECGRNHIAFLREARRKNIDGWALREFPSEYAAEWFRRGTVDMAGWTGTPVRRLWPWLCMAHNLLLVAVLFGFGHLGIEALGG